MLKIVSTQEYGPIHAGELTALIRMDQHLVLRLSSPDGYHQGLQNDICRLTALHGPADHAPGVKIDDHRKVDEPFLRPDIGNIGHPNLVRGLDVELPVKSIIDHDRWLATITAGAAPVADLRLDTCKLSQSGYPVRTDALALFNQIVMELAIAIDLAALRPGLLQQLVWRLSSCARAGVVCGRGRNPTLRLWPTIFSGKIDVFRGDRRSRLISSMTSVAPA